MNEPFELSANPWVSMLPQGAVGAPSGTGMLWDSSRFPFPSDLSMPSDPIDPTVMQSSLEAATMMGVALHQIVENINHIFNEVGKVFRRIWDNLTRAVRGALTIIKKSEAIKGKPHAHRKRINQRRLRVAQRNMANTDFFRYHDIVPERIHEDFQLSYHARMERVQSHLHEYIDVDLPLMDDEGDW